jgi:hypothetical protein
MMRDITHVGEFIDCSLHIVSIEFSEERVALMTRQFLLGTAAALLIAVPASALTMTPITDGRTIDAFAAAGQATDSNSDSPGSDFSVFDSDVSASVLEFGDFGAGAGSNAQQLSGLGPLSISGSGETNAGGSHGEIPLTAALGDAETPPLGRGEFLAGANSVLEILFRIDEAAEFSLEGFISAGIEQAPGFGDGDIESGTMSVASVILLNQDTNTTVYEQEVSEDSLKFVETGVIQEGNYLFTLRAAAGVFGGLYETLTLGDSDSLDTGVYQTSASFGGNLVLTPTDQPIPEPVTTTLAAMGLGALVLRTSRRRA